VIKAYLKYRNQAVNEHKIHSPFVFEFFNEIIKKAKYLEDESIETMRRNLLKKKDKKVQVNDLGQGSRKSENNERSISEMVKVQSISRKYGRLLSRIVQHYQLDNCLELGTSLGFGTAYLSQNAKKVVTIEGCENTQIQAKKIWGDIPKAKNQYVLGDFSTALPKVLGQMEKVDLAYIDGNHGYEPTLKYFEMILEKAHNNTFIVFDDINWSLGMRKAWDEIVASNKINLSMELFRMGIVLKRSEQAKEPFVLKF
jgi:predicted O-methyltransferase YrrM